MQIRWREHEKVLVTMMAITLLAGYLWRFHNGDPESLASPFIAYHIPFNIYRNAVLPDIGLGLLFYLSYLITSRFVVSSLSGARAKGAEKTGIRLFLWVLGLILLWGTALNIALYYKHEWLFMDSGFQKEIPGGYLGALLACLFFAFYVCIREVIIHVIQRSGGRRAYFTLICNKITVFSMIYIMIPFTVAVFHLFHDGQIIAVYFSLIIPVFLTYLLNTYWLFPLKDKRSFFNPFILFRLLLSTFLCSMPFLLSPMHEGQGLALLSCWAMLLLVVTPVIWLLYQLRKDKILQLRGMEEAVTKSTADLQFLRSQINPHFLFNALNTIYGTALQENADRTAGIVQKLGDMMRFMLRENTKDLIGMELELNYLKDYIALQRLRIGSSDNVTIEEQIGEEHCNHRIAPMLLIPFVENAFKHGIRLDQKSWIKVTLACTPAAINFEVRNSVHPPGENDPEKESYGIGNKNVLERLKILYPARHQVSITSNEKEYIVQLVILLTGQKI